MSSSPPDPPGGPDLAGSGPPGPVSFLSAGRGPRLLGGGGRRATAISTASTLVVLAALVAAFLLAPGSAEVRHTFFSPHDMWRSFVGDPAKGGRRRQHLVDWQNGITSRHQRDGRREDSRQHNSAAGVATDKIAQTFVRRLQAQNAMR